MTSRLASLCEHKLEATGQPPTLEGKRKKYDLWVMKILPLGDGASPSVQVCLPLGCVQVWKGLLDKTE